MVRDPNLTSLPTPVPIDASRQENIAPAISALFTHLTAIVFTLNRGITPHSVIAPSAANTEFPLVHSLNRIPVGYFVIAKDRACDIYSSSSGSWTNRVLYLKSSVANAVFSIVVF